MAKIISIVNLKGGVGKTAIAVNFAAYCGSRGKKTLLVDLDPQTNATFSCLKVEEWEEHATSHGTIANVLGHRAHTTAEETRPNVDSVIKRDVFLGVDLVPSHLDLFTVDLDLAGATGRENRLKRALAPVLDQYEIVVCDCPPNLTIPTQNALAASTHYAVPISPDFLSGIGVGILFRRVRQFCADLQHELALAGIIISRVGRPAEHRRQSVQALRTTFGDKVLRTELTERVAVSESVSKQKPVLQHSDDKAVSEFTEMSKELLTQLGRSR